MTQRNLLIEILRCEFENKCVSGPSFTRLVDIVFEQLPANFEYKTIYESCRHLIGIPLTTEVIRSFSHLVMGNQPRLASRRAVKPWVVQKIKEWVPLHITSVKREHKEKKGFGGVFSFFVLAGQPCGMTIKRWWSMKFCRYIASDMQFSRPPGRNSLEQPKYHFTALEQFVTLRVYGLVTPDLCKVNEPMFAKIQTTPSLDAWNKEQLKFRFRVDPGYVCPEGYSNDFPCHHCDKGYTSCRAGTHAKDYLYRKCGKCNEPLAAFDPDRAADMCVQCYFLASSWSPKK